MPFDDVPFATVGGVFALYVTHTVLSVSAAVGFITLFGVAVMDGVLLITYIRQARAKTPGSEEAIFHAVSQRLRPVLMTALAMILGMLPAALALGEGGEQNAPLGRAVIGGLVFATIATLMFVPVVFSIIHGRHAARAAKKAGKGAGEAYA